MLCFDKLKIVTSTKHIKRFDESKFHSDLLDGKIQSYKYKQTMPLVLIMINYDRDELVIEFTSKILMFDFIKLINMDTICECLNSLPYIEFDNDVEFLLGDFEVLKCDVTQDVSYGYDVKRLEQYAKSNLINYDKWKCEKHRSGFALRNVAATPRHKKRIVIYDKGEELKLKKNKAFVDEVDRNYFIEDYFRDKVRFEMNINTKFQIRQFLGIQDNKLTSVLNSDANPILAILNEAIKEPIENTYHISSIKDYYCELTLKDCNYNMGEVEAKIRSLVSKNTSIKRMMEPYRELYQRIQNNKGPAFDLRKLVG